MKITMLGCGTSVGVPSLGILGWGKCNPNNPKNRRQRSSVLIQENGFNILIDAGPDVRNQLLDTKIEKIFPFMVTKNQLLKFINNLTFSLIKNQHLLVILFLL